MSRQQLKWCMHCGQEVPKQVYTLFYSLGKNIRSNVCLHFVTLNCAGTKMSITQPIYKITTKFLLINVQT